MQERVDDRLIRFLRKLNVLNQTQVRDYSTDTSAVLHRYENEQYEKRSRKANRGYKDKQTFGPAPRSIKPTKSRY